MHYNIKFGERKYMSAREYDIVIRFGRIVYVTKNGMHACIKKKTICSFTHVCSLTPVTLKANLVCYLCYFFNA